MGRERPILERDGQFLLLCVPDDFLYLRNEESLFTFDVIFLHIGAAQFNVHLCMPSLEPIVCEVLPGLYVVLVTVRPMQVHLFSVVRNCVSLPLRIPHAVPI